MGKGVQRLGDPNTAGGVIVSGVDYTVLANGRPVAVPLGTVTPHPPCSPKQPQHCVTKTVGPGSKTVRVNGKPLLLTGDKDSCVTHSRALGSPNVKAI